MPATHHRTFTVRYHECDAFGFLKPISYLRWMQESAFAASAEVGYDFAQYHHIGQIWLVRESQIAYFTALKYGDEVEITTWVTDIRRFRSLRAYELRDTRTGALSARATTDWVYLDTASLRPVAIPQAMGSAFFPEGVPENSAARDRFPKNQGSPAHAVVLCNKVVWDDLDMMWHVNNAAYLNYMDDVEKYALSSRGWSMQRFRELGMRIDPQRQRIEYLHPATLDDAIEITTWCSNFTDDSAVRHFEIRRSGDGKLLVQAFKHWGIRGLQGEVLPLPADFRPG